MRICLRNIEYQNLINNIIMYTFIRALFIDNFILETVEYLPWEAIRYCIMTPHDKARSVSHR